VKRFREFIVFNSDQILVEYLVAYKRRRMRCDCGLEVTVKSVVNGRPENHGRLIHFCPKDREDVSNCGYMQMFPQCFCGEAATIKVSKKQKKYYACPQKVPPWCVGFLGFVDSGGSAGSSPAKRQRMG
jgi:hypothetical protein